MVELCRVAGDAGGRDLPAPSARLLRDTGSLIRQFRAEGATPADRISYALAGMVHLEWYRDRASLVIAVDGPRSAEVSWYSREGESRRERYEW